MARSQESSAPSAIALAPHRQACNLTRRSTLYEMPGPMIRIAAILVVSLALAAPLGGCGKRGKLDVPPDYTAGRSYPAPVQ